MLDREALCEKIISIYPDIGKCGMDIDVDYDVEKQSTVIHMRRGNKKVKHCLPDEDAEACMAGRQCIALGVGVAQLRDGWYL